MTNLEMIKGLYENFSAGNVPGVLAAMHDNIVWNEAENFPYADQNPYTSPQLVHIWTLANGKIAQFQQHVDTLAVHHAGAV